MTRPRSSVLIWGILSLVTGALMTEGGVMEVVTYWSQGQASPVAVGALGALASAILLVSGAAFCAGRRFGRRTAIAGAIGMVPVHLAGWLLGFVGIPGVLFGVVYPALLLLVLWAKPGLGTPSSVGIGQDGRRQSLPADHSKQRAALTAA
jgi:hypothetical protein